MVSGLEWLKWGSFGSGNDLLTALTPCRRGAGLWSLCPRSFFFHLERHLSELFPRGELALAVEIADAPSLVLCGGGAFAL